MKPINFFALRNWSRYSRQFADDKEMLYKYKRIILLSQFTLVGSIVGVIHSLEDLVDGLLFMPMMDIIMASFIFLCYLLNENGRHKLARVVLLTFLNIYFFVYSSLVPRDLGIYLYYFPWIGLAAVLFEINESVQRFFFIGLSILLLIVLFASDFNAFGDAEFQAIDLDRSFIINLVSSIAVLVFFIAFMVNVNEHSEKKLYELAEEVKVKNTDLEKANRELDRFFYSASHDLKTPLMNIKGILNMAMSEQHDASVVQYFLMIKESTSKLDGFLQDILDYSRNSQTGAKREPVNIHYLVDEVVANFRFISGADKIRFERDINLSHPIETDRVRLLIVLNNIVANAIKYHRQDIRDRWIRMAAAFTDNKLVLTVTDNGQGIEEDLLPKIFNMFFRGTNQSKGSGLGLYIVKETIEKLGGAIDIQSEVNKGTQVTVSVPAVLLSHIKLDVAFAHASSVKII